MTVRTPISKSSGMLRQSVGGSSVTLTPVRTPTRTYGNATSKGNGHANGHVPSNGHRKKSKKTKLWSPWKLIMYSVLFGVLGSIYLTHVFQMQNTLREVQQLRRDYERAERLHTDTRRNYDRMTGPAEVYRRAESLGMVTGGAVDPVIFIKN